MSKKVLVRQIQPVVDGPQFGPVSSPAQFQNSQLYAHSHVERIVRDLLMDGATNPLTSGFNYTLPGNLNVSIAAGQVVTPAGLSHDTLPLGQAHQVTLAAAHPSLPRIDLIYALLETDVEAEAEFRPYVRLRTQEELAANVSPYAPEQFNQPTELHTRATIAVRSGTANGSPVAPTVNAGEVALFTVRVEASAMVLTSEKVTDVRSKALSLYNATTVVSTLSESIDDRVNTLVVDSTYLSKTYDDGAGLLNLDVDLNALYTPLDGRYKKSADFDESVDDRVNALIGSSTYLSKVYDDNGNVLHLDINLTALDAHYAVNYDSLYVNVTGDTMTNTLSLNPGAGTLLPNTSKTMLSLAAGSTLGAAQIELKGVESSGTGTYAGARMEFSGIVGGDGGTGRFDWYTATSQHRGLWEVNNGMTFRTISCNTGGVPNAFIFRSIDLSGLGGGPGNILAAQNAAGSNMFTVGQNGNVSVAGTLSKGSGTFKIDHPLDPANKDLYHGFVESNEYMLFYRVKGSMFAGHAEIDMDEWIEMTSGTFEQIAQDADIVSVYSSSTSKITASIDGPTVSIQSENIHDNALVTVLICASRADAFIKTVNNVNEQGRLVCEQDKPEPTEDDLALLEPTTKILYIKESEVSTTSTAQQNETVGALAGKKGYPQFPELYDIEQPTRQVSIILSVEGEDGSTQVIDPDNEGGSMPGGGEAPGV